MTKLYFFIDRIEFYFLEMFFDEMFSVKCFILHYIKDTTNTLRGCLIKLYNLALNESNLLTDSKITVRLRS